MSIRPVISCGESLAVILRDLLRSFKKNQPPSHYSLPAPCPQTVVHRRMRQPRHHLGCSTSRSQTEYISRYLVVSAVFRSPGEFVGLPEAKATPTDRFQTLLTLGLAPKTQYLELHALLQHSGAEMCPSRNR